MLFAPPHRAPAPNKKFIPSLRENLYETLTQVCISEVCTRQEQISIADHLAQFFCRARVLRREGLHGTITDLADSGQNPGCVATSPSLWASGSPFSKCDGSCDLGLSSDNLICDPVQQDP
jgi:hypothetical protein